MNILVSNDDGVYAPGLAALAEAMSVAGEVTVIAPDTNQSASSNSLTLTRPLRPKQLENGFYSVNGTPTDCVHMAVTGFLQQQYDIVVSGINDGANLGDDILYSGTVAAAMEGRFLGLPAIAFSLVVSGGKARHLETAAKIARQIVLKMRTSLLPSQTILNVNIPDVPYHDIQGIHITRLGKRHASEPTVQSYDPRGNAIYWIGPPGSEAEAGPGTDFFAIKNNFVSVTPLQLDMTHYSVFDQLASVMKDVTCQS